MAMDEMLITLQSKFVHGSDRPAARVGSTFRRAGSGRVGSGRVGWSGSKKSSPWTTLLYCTSLQHNWQSLCQSEIQEEAIPLFPHTGYATAYNNCKDILLRLLLLI